MSIRAASPDDLDAIMAIERASFPTDAWSAPLMAEELASPHGHYVVLEEAGRIVGYAGLRALPGARDADVQTIALAAAARGHGQGRALLRALLEEAERRSVREVFLEVRADNPVAQRLYASEGFAELGRRPRYYQPDGVDAIVMRRDARGQAVGPVGADAAGTGASGVGADAGPSSDPLGGPSFPRRSATERTSPAETSSARQISSAATDASEETADTGTPGAGAAEQSGKDAAGAGTTGGYAAPWGPGTGEKA
jgi:ribosomal-protein-alanine acetyltransferase